MALFKEDGTFDVEYYNAHKSEVDNRPGVRHLGEIFKDCIARAEPNSATLRKSNFVIRFDVTARSFTIATKPLEQQDINLKYAETNAVYTYEEGELAPILTDLEIPDTIKVYHKDFHLVSNYLSKVFSGAGKVTEDDDGVSMSDMLMANPEPNDVIEFATGGGTTVGDGWETVTTYEFDWESGRTGGRSYYTGTIDGTALCSDRTKRIRVHVLPNPAVETVETGLSGGSLGFRQNDLTS